MADLSAYASFAVEFDKSTDTPVIRVTDTSDYPSGVGSGVTATVVVTQPDGMEVEGAVGANIELRLSNNDDFQKGEYTISFTAEHMSYDDTVLTKQFYLFYTPPNVSIEQDFNVFTPSLKATDDTVYTTAGFTLDQVARAWSAVITNVGSVTGGNSAEFDIKYSGSYYDSAYLVKLTTTPTYHLTNDVSITVKDRIEESVSYRTKVPKSLNDIFAEIIKFKKRIDDKKCCDNKSDKRLEFAYIMTLFEFYKARGLCGTSLSKLIDLHDELIDLLDDCFTGYKNTYLPISAYSFNDFCGCCGGESETPNTAPTVNAGNNATIQLPTSSTTLTGTATGTGLTYLWTKDSGPGGSSFGTPSAISTTVTGLAEGTHVFRLTVTDSQGQTAYDTIQITVSPIPVDTTHAVDYGWTSSAVNAGNVASISTPQSITVNNGAASFGFTVALEFVYLVVSEPATEPAKVRYTNVLNNEPMDDYTWAAPVVIGSKRYYFTKGPRGFDGSGATTFYTT